MEKLTVVGLDLAKNIFQVHGIDDRGRKLCGRKLKRSETKKTMGCALLHPSYELRAAAWRKTVGNYLLLSEPYQVADDPLIHGY